MALSRFSTTGQTDLEKDADLAIFLVDHLESLRDRTSGAWPGERETRRLQNTCHAIEALHELALGPVSQRLVVPGARWLTDLPFLREVLRQDQRSLRVFPMRFKTLAMLGQFDAGRLSGDWSSLCGHFEAASGWLTDVPGDFSRVMNTMVWADTLVYLQQGGAAAGLWERWLDPGLVTLDKALAEWLGDPRGERSTPVLRGVREASYAFEILARAGRFSPESAQGEQIAAALVEASNTSTRDRLRTTLYFGVQLSTYFRGHGPATAATTELVRVVRERYEAAAHIGQPDYFHAVVLRLLRARYGDALRDSILETLWLRSRQAVAERQDGLEREQKAALEDLVHRRINVKLGTVSRLSGTRTRGSVYRVHFSLDSEATDREGHVFSVMPEALQLIVKQGSIESLSRTIRRYNELPADLRKVFAHHSNRVEALHGGWYLTMEDLVNMLPLAEVLDQVDLRWTGRGEHATLVRLAESIGETLATLHRHRRRPAVASNELGWLYLTPITEALNSACDDEALAELKPFIEGGFRTNGRDFCALADYEARLQTHAIRLKPPALGAAHGDCHSRNLMVDSRSHTVKFIDLETLTYSDDWLTDYALLLEDIALYRYLPRGQRPDALAADEITYEAGRIDYPALPRGGESVAYFQEQLLVQARTFAEAVDDMSYRPRLWLAIVRNLIQLISRQLPVASLEPYRRNETLRLCLVAYAEAARLLQELSDHLDGAALADMPFGARAATARATP